jgi:hypothetical protein
MSEDFTDAIFHRPPIDQPTVAGVGYDAAKTLVILENVRQQGAGNELIKQLPQGQLQTLVPILGNDEVGLLDDFECRATRFVGNEHFTGHAGALAIAALA